jgi:hypothetical protein
MFNLITKDMVKVIDYQQKENPKTKTSYAVLVLQGDPEVLISKSSGKPYLTAKRTSIPCTLDETSAKALIGSELEGSIERVACTPFEVKLATGKKVKITTAFQFVPPEPVHEKEFAQ